MEPSLTSSGYLFLAVSACSMILPFFLVMRWNGIGFLVSVLFGWGSIHLVNLVTVKREALDAVFSGVWELLGGVFMVLWCALCVTVILIASTLRLIARSLIVRSSASNPNMRSSPTNPQNPYSP